MRLLDSEQAGLFYRSAIAGVPRQVLEVIAHMEGAREMQVVREVARWLPSGADTATIADRVSQSLGYLIVRGDVERGPGRVYRCLPPYLVGPPDESAGSVLRLHGDPRAESSILTLLRGFGARLGQEASLADELPTTPQEAAPDMGSLERTISLAGSELIPTAATACESRGYTVLRPDELGERLPRTDNVLCPPESELTPADDLHKHVWEVYKPGNPGEDRWQHEDRWRSGGSRLVRLRSSDERLGESGARVFYHGGRGRVVQLEPQAGSLWQFYLDLCSGNPRIFWWHGTQIWVPRVVPFATLRWLELLAGRRARPSGQRLKFLMRASSVPTARTVLAETLGLRCREDRPPRERYRRGSQGRWGR